MADTLIDMIGIGSPLIDQLAFVEDTWLSQAGGAKGGMELIDDAGMTTLVGKLPDTPVRVAGGSAANTTFGLAKLGMSCAFLGKLGNDDHGDLYRKLFSEAAIAVDRFKLAPEIPTGSCLCLVTPDSERTMRTNLGAAMTLAADDITTADFAGCRHAHMEGYVLFNRDLARKILESAREAGCSVSLDLASFEVVEANSDVLGDLLDGFVDIVFANEDEAKAFTGSDEPEKGLDQLGRYCETVAVKLGARGAWLQRGTERVHVPAHTVKAVDTTGAGDLWAAGFLYGHFHDRDLSTCGRYGAITGAEVVQVLGAAIAEDRWNHIKETII